MTNVSESENSFQFAMMKKKDFGFFSKPSCFGCFITLFDTPVIEFCDAVDKLIEERNTHPDDNKITNYSTETEVKVGYTILRRRGAMLTICWNLNDVVHIPEISVLQPLTKILRKQVKNESNL